MKIIRKKNPIDIKQPQEIYCSNFECLNLAAKFDELYNLMDEYGIELADDYCLDCIMNGNME
jgi:hypothetical protein